MGSSPPLSPSRHCTVTIEEVEDVDAPQRPGMNDIQGDFFLEAFEDEAGTPVGKAEGTFQKLRREQKENAQDPWYPFESQDEWELARWLILSGVSQEKMDAFLKLNAVSRSSDANRSCTYSESGPTRH